MSAPEAMAADAIEIHPGTPNVYFTCEIEKGEATGPIFEKAAYVVEDDFYVGRQPHMTMETDVGYAYSDAEGNLYINTKSIAVYIHPESPTPGIPVTSCSFPKSHRRNLRHKFSPTIRLCLALPQWPPAGRSSCVMTTIST